jgi:hypothetical protein
MTDETRRSFLRATLAAGAALLIPARSMAEALVLAGPEARGLVGYDPPLTEEKLDAIFRAQGWERARLYLGLSALRELLAIFDPPTFQENVRVSAIPDNITIYQRQHAWPVVVDYSIPDGYVKVEPLPIDPGAFCRAAPSTMS